MRRILAATIAFAAAISLVACDQKPEKKKDAITISGGGGKITIESAGGKSHVEISTTGEAKAKLPGWVPAYRGAQIQNSMQGSGEDGKGGGIVFTTSHAPDAVIAFYRKAAKQTGLREAMNAQTGETMMFVARGDDNQKTLHVSATRTADGSQVSVFWGTGD